jgi:hypothetical protein
MAHRDQWDAGDEAWLRKYVATDDYAHLAGYYAARGLEWGDSSGEQPGFKSAL